MRRSVAAVAILLAGGLLVPAVAGCSGPPPDVAIVAANDMLVPGSDLNVVRYSWKDAADPSAVWMEVHDKSGNLVRTLTNLPTHCAPETTDFAEHRWNALDDRGQALAEAASPFVLTIHAVWGRATVVAHCQASVEEWHMPITIADSSGEGSGLVSGVDESTVTPETLTITVTVDGGKTVTPKYAVSADKPAPGQLRGNDWACIATPLHLFYATPRAPYEIRYTVVIEQHTTTEETANSLVIKTVMDGLLNPWDMDPAQPGRQTKSTWRFGILPASLGGPVMSNFEERYE
jgi:hypothetical protein